jgi:heme exporter protein CcmD
MYFDSFAEFLRMGDHGLYVWVAYGAALLVLLSTFFITRTMSRSVEENIRWAILSRQAAQDASMALRQEDSDES